MKIFSCDSCNEKFDNYVDLINHQIQKHAKSSCYKISINLDPLEIVISKDVCDSSCLYYLFWDNIETNNSNPFKNKGYKGDFVYCYIKVVELGEIGIQLECIKKEIAEHYLNIISQDWINGHIDYCTSMIKLSSLINTKGNINELSKIMR